ncbi:MAG: glycosyltransferase family 2 protein [Campylobacterales bacterium]|nr:glycosyltransferase family 2 protein [Campylobacterales bacterium]
MRLGIVVPCYNEEEVLSETAARLLALLDRLIERGIIDAQSRICFVDDGSKDTTWSLIEQLCLESLHVSGLKLSRNRGHQNALLAGLLTVEGDALISIDADLQDDITIIEQMVEQYHKGFDVVYGVRKERTVDTPFKRATAEGFYKLMRLMGVDIVYNHADYRLLSRRALEELRRFKEVNLFLRAMVPLLGFKSTQLYYDRAERFAGESKYPLKKMLSFAWDGITSFSIMPLRFITATGFLIFIATLLMSAWVLGVKLFSDEAVPGWASTVLPIYFIGGIQVFALGIVGEYIGKIYMESKERPRFIIEKKI